MIAALCYGERVAGRRAAEAASLAPDARGRQHQEQVAAKERHSADLLEFRLAEIGSPGLQDAFRPFFDAFFDRTEPADWVEAVTFHYVGDAMVSDFADVLIPLLDPVSGEIVRRVLGEREAQATFALDELTRAMEQDPGVRERIREYSQRIVGEGVTQTSRAIQETEGLRSLLGGSEEGKRLVLQILDGHRQRLDRLGIDPVDD